MAMDATLAAKPWPDRKLHSAGVNSLKFFPDG
jgi:hypothetical protein